MGDIAQRGNRLTAAKGGRIGKFGGGRTNLLEELGRVEAEPSNRNRRAEISRVHGELNRGYAKGGRAGYAIGGVIKKVISKLYKGKGKGEKGLGSGIKPSEMHEIIPKGDRKLYLKEKLANPHKRIGKAKGGRIGLKKGGSDKNWIQKAVNPKHKGYCTPMTKKTCTPARKALARTFKKKAKTGW